jgi:hypothetical protein
MNCFTEGEFNGGMFLTALSVSDPPGEHSGSETPAFYWEWEGTRGNSVWQGLSVNQHGGEPTQQT